MFVTFIEISFQIVYFSVSQPAPGGTPVVYFCFYFIINGPPEISKAPQRVL